MFSAWYFGAGPAVLSSGAFVALQYWLAGRTPESRMPDTPYLFVSFAFLLASTAIIITAEKRRLQNQALWNEQAELENRVKERTAQLDIANRSLRDLSARLLQMQDEERRRIARELHDSVGQLLVGLSMNLSTVRGEIERLTKAAAVLGDSENLIQEMSKEVRTISHLLHPPLLDEAGLASAIRWYIDGFMQRSHIKVDLDCPEDFGRLPRDLEIAIFRVVQECLTNIHRHSGSQVASIRCRVLSNEAFVEIADRGTGISPERLAIMGSVGMPGVGIRGMKERLRQLGGDLEVTSDRKGTVVKARLTFPDKSSADNSSDLDASKTAA
jgi:signal transduction histidine kinase